MTHPDRRAPSRYVHDRVPSGFDSFPPTADNTGPAVGSATPVSGGAETRMGIKLSGTWPTRGSRSGAWPSGRSLELGMRQQRSER